MKLSIKAGTTSKLVDVFIQDSSSTVGAGLTGLVFNSGSLTAYYYREGAASATAITLATMTLGTWATGGFVVVDGTNMPGCYQLGLPDAAVAAGAKSVIVMLKGASNMAPLLLEIELTAVDNQDAVRGGMTALPNANAAASGGLIINGSNSGAVTLAGLATGALSCTTVTASGAVAFQSTLTVTGATTLTGAVTASNASNNIAVNVVSTNGVAVFNEDGTCANAAPSSTLFKFPATDSAGNAIPDSDQYQWTALRIVGGTGIGQVVLLTTGTANPREYTILTGTAPATVDNTSTYVINGAWRANTTHLAGTANVGTAGYAGVDWGQVINKTTVNALTNTTISGGGGLTAAQVWDYLTSSIVTSGSIGKLLVDDTGADTPGTTTLLGRLTSLRATGLDNLDTTVSSRSTYAGTDTSGTTTLLARLTALRAGYLDNLSAGAVALASGVILTSAGLDAVLVESGISASSILVNDTGTQLTAINARQALAVVLGATGAVLAGALTTSITIQPGAKPVANPRVTATCDSSGNRSAVSLRVPN